MRVKVRRDKIVLLRPKELEFLGEQDGPVEQELKGKLIELIQLRPHVLRAYLARIGFGPSSAETSVGLCLRSDVEDLELVRGIGRVFAGMFPATVHMDIMFIDPHQESELAKLCKPFFGGAA